MKIALITGFSGLVGSEAARFFNSRGFHIVGIDNYMRARLFCEEASTKWNREELKKECADLTGYDVDIRDVAAVSSIFSHEVMTPRSTIS